MEDVLHRRFPHGIHIPPRDQNKLRVAEQPAGAEQPAFQPQAALCRSGDHAKLRCQDRQDAVRLFIAGLLQDKPRCYNGFYRLFLPLKMPSVVLVVCNQDKAEYFPYRQMHSMFPVIPSRQHLFSGLVSDLYCPFIQGNSALLTCPGSA